MQYRVDTEAIEQIAGQVQQKHHFLAFPLLILTIAKVLR